MSNANEPAKPCRATINRDTGELQPFQFGNNDFECLGLTKREYFAGLALQGLLAGPHAESDCGIEGLAHDAVLAADKLLAALEGNHA